MQKFSKPSISTGTFAKLCGTNKRTLIHYDEIGLFPPAFVDKRGYRYYSEKQCDVFSIITALREIGMPLMEIKSYLDSREPSRLKELLLSQHKRIQEEQSRLLAIDQVICTKLSLVETAAKVPLDTVALEEFPEEYLILSEPVNSNNHDKVIAALYKHIAFCNSHCLNSGHPYGAMIAKEHLYTGELDTYAYFFTKVPKPPVACPYYQKPAGLYAFTYLKGDYYQAGPAYEALLHYLDEKGLELADYSFKEGILDELAVKEAKDYITRISVHVKKREYGSAF